MQKKTSFAYFHDIYCIFWYILVHNIIRALLIIIVFRYEIMCVNEMSFNFKPTEMQF